MVKQCDLYQSFLATRIMEYCNVQGGAQSTGEKEAPCARTARIRKVDSFERVKRFLLEEERFFQALIRYGIRPDQPAKGKYDRETREARIHEAYQRVEKARRLLHDAFPCSFNVR